MSDESAFRDGLSALSLFFVRERSQHDTLQRVAELAVESIGPAEFAGLTMLTAEGRPTTAVFTDPESPDIDQAQYRAMDGPCLEAFRTGEIREMADAGEPGPWQAFREACVEHDIRSTLSLPLWIDSTGYGALNLYARAPLAFTGHDLTTATLFATQAAVVLANAQAYWEAHTLSEQLSTALLTRPTIDQAKGIIMATMGCGPDDAFQILSRQSQQQNRKLADVAADIVANANRKFR